MGTPEFVGMGGWEAPARGWHLKQGQPCGGLRLYLVNWKLPWVVSVRTVLKSIHVGWKTEHQKCKSLITPGFMGHENKIGFHSKCNTEPLKDCGFSLESGLLFSPFCLAAVWKSGKCWRRKTSWWGLWGSLGKKRAWLGLESGRDEQHAD